MNTRKKRDSLLLADKIFNNSVSICVLMYKKFFHKNFFSQEQDSFHKNFFSHKQNSVHSNSFSQKQGSALIIALALLFFITTLGTIVLHTAHRFQALAIERSLQRPPQMLLESIIVYACQTEGAAWYKVCAETAGVQPHETYTATINGVVCTLHVSVEKGAVVLHASCPGTRGITHTRISQVPHTYVAGE